MNYDKKTIRDIDVSGKKILLRCDFNVPHDKTTGIIHDDTRIVSTLPTIRYLLEHNAAVILLSHMGRPHGQWKKELSLFSARDHLEKLLGIPVPLTQDELQFMGAALEAPKRPLVAILGGAKVADKIGVIKNLLQKADTILIGGGMSYTFLAAQGRPIGTSLLDADHVDYARQMLD